MKKKILGGIAAIAIATVVALNMQIMVGENDQITDLSMANVEALAQHEESAETGQYYDCQSTFVYGFGWLARACDGCTHVTAAWIFGPSYCYSNNVL